MATIIVLLISIYVHSTAAIFGLNSYPVNKEWKDIFGSCKKEKSCSVYCVAKAFNMTNNNGDIISDNIPHYEMVSLMTDCFDKDSATEKCTKLANIGKCLIGEINVLYQNMTSDCLEETKLSLAPPKFMDLMKLAKDKNYYCLNRCMMVKMGIINENNQATVNSTGIVEIMSEEHANEMQIDVAECINAHRKRDQCEHASKTGLCFMKTELTRAGFKDLKKVKKYFDGAMHF